MLTIGFQLNEKLPKLGVFINKPTYFEPDIASAACFIKFEDKILFLKKQKGKWSENLWGVPCGTIELNEEICEAMQRELKEETGIELQRDKLKYLGKLFIVQNDFVNNIHHVFYYKTTKNLDVCLSDEHSDYKWLDKNEISSFSLIPNQDKVLSKFKIYEQ